MKKFFYSMFALASMLLATGCSQEEEPIVNSSNDYVEASFTVDLGNEVQSRGLGEADLVNQLYYGIYQDGKVIPVITNVDDAAGNFNTVNVGEAEVKSRQATVKMRLVKGQTYDFVFWAQVKDNKHYNINMNDLQNITVNYNGDANDETRDAFFARELGYKVQSHFTKTITLKRPFAQVNVGTTKADFEAARILLGGSPITQSNLIVTKIPTSLNLLSGKVGTDATANAEFKMAFLPKEGDAYTQNGYDILKADVDGNKEYSWDEEYAHLSMNYLLAAERTDAELSEVSVEFANAKGSINTIKVSQLPVYRNYRTNILGNILTTNGEFTIIVDEAFEQEEIIRELWDGESTEAVTAKNENGVSVYEIANAKQLAWVAEQVNSGENTFAGAIVRLTADIYLNNQPWTPIGLANGKQDVFKGTFDGNDFTIYELNIVAENTSRALKEGDKNPAGLFGKVEKGIVKNFKVNGANVSHISASGQGIAVIAGEIFEQATIEKVIVTNAVLKGNRQMGGIVGSGYGKIIDCTVENVKLTATPEQLKNSNGELVWDNGDKVGGIIGACWNATLSGNKVSNVIIMGYRDLGGIAGLAGTDNYATKVENSVVNGLDIIVDNSHNYKNYTTELEHNVGGIVGRKGTGFEENTSNEISDVEVIYSEPEGVTLPVTNAEEFKAAIDAGIAEIAVAGEIDLTQVTFPTAGDLTLVGVNEDAVLNALSATSYYSCGGANISFKNLTIKLKGNNYGSTGLANFGGKHTYDNCKFEGTATVWGECTYNNCEFTATVDGQYAAFAQSWYPVVYNNCKFTASNRAVKVCPIKRSFENGGASEMGDVTVEYNNCTFISSTPNKPAVVITNGENTNNKNTTRVEVKITNATIANMADSEEYYGNEYFGIEGENVVVTLDDATYAKVQGDISEVLKATTKTIDIELSGNATTKGQTGAYAFESLNINGNSQTLTFEDTYRTYIKTAGGKVVLNNVNVSRQSTGGTHWHDNNMKFSSDVEMNNVTFDKGITIDEVKAVLNNVTITKNKVATYGLFIVCGSNVEMDGCTIAHADGVAGRGIKVVTENASNKTADTYLKVSNTSFNTEEKAAILAVSEGGLVDIEINNIDITNVKEDNVYAVWVDEDAAAYADKVRVVGGKKKIEGQKADGVSQKDNVYSISNANGMLWFANEVNVNGNTFAGKTVKMIADIDLQGIDWEPISQASTSKYFQGTFDGNEYTISNLSVDSDAETGQYYASGIFGWLNGATIKNVNVNVAKIVGHKYCGVIAGYITKESAVTSIINCHVVNAEVVNTYANKDADGGHAGVIVGYAKNQNTPVKECSATNSTVSTARRGGQIAGSALEANIIDCTATNVKVTDNKTGIGDSINEDLIGLK